MQNAFDGLDGEQRENFHRFQSLRFLLSKTLCLQYYFWCREEGGWEGDHGAVRKVRAQCSKDVRHSSILFM